MPVNVTSFIDPASANMFIQICIAALLGVLIGAERSAANKTAGMRTYGLISLGSCLFVVISNAVYARFEYAKLLTFDPLHMATQVVLGIGFVGGGMIVTKPDKISGVTTAAGIWVAAGIGMAVGFELYTLAILVTALTLAMFTLLWHFEVYVKKYAKELYHDGESAEK